MVLRYIPVSVFLFFCLFEAHPKPASAACNESFAKIALHVTAPTTKLPCGPSQIACEFPTSEVVATGDLDQEYRVYVLLADWKDNPFLQVQIGAYYDPVDSSGVDVLGFQTCASSTTPIGDWPGSGSELVMTWSSCQSSNQDDVFVLGWFSIIAHTQGSLSITPLSFSNAFDPGSRTVCRLFTCDSQEKILGPERMGQATFGGGIGFDPCSGFIDAFPGPCCLVNSCIPQASLGCCWAQGGTLLDYMSTCGACTLDFVPNTWGRLKSRY